jgi:hypothetical protein
MKVDRWKAAAVLAALATVATLPGCADDGSGGGGVVVDDGGMAPQMPSPDLGSPYPAAFPAPPQVVNTLQGPVLTAPNVIPVFFSTTDATVKSKAIDFLSKLPGSDYWKQTTTEYGVGPITVGKAVVLPQSPTGTMTSQEVETWILNLVSMNASPLPQPDDNTIYVFNFPPSLTITQKNFFGTGMSCQDFGGYHSSVSANLDKGIFDVAYAVIPQCATFGAWKGIDALTSTTSHELIEAATDPYPRTNPAFAGLDADHFYWLYALGGGEIGDLCAQDPASFYRSPEIGYVVQRTWSNQEALAGHDPCVPARGTASYFNAAPELGDMITLAVGQQSFSFLGAQIAVGSSKTIPIDLFSDGDTGGTWTVSAHDLGALQGSPTLQFTFDKRSGVNGDKINMTIKVTAKSMYGVSIFYLTSKSGAVEHTWWGAVAQ